MATYKVKKSDNLPKIAQKFNVPLNQLSKQNQGGISTGQVIKIPSPQSQFMAQYPSQGTIGGNIFSSNAGPMAFAPTGFVGGKSISQAPMQPSYSGGNINVGYNLPPQPVQPLQPVGLNAADRSSYMQANIGGGRGTMNPTTAGVNAFDAPVTRLPSGVYTGGTGAGDQAWRNYWDASARAGRDLAGRGQNKDFPGFWGGGKGGGFFKTLREAKQATHRKDGRTRDEGGGEYVPQVQQVYTPPAVVKPAVVSGRDETVTWNIG